MGLKRLAKSICEFAGAFNRPVHHMNLFYATVAKCLKDRATGPASTQDDSALSRVPAGMA
jgi:hypothetical protein